MISKQFSLRDKKKNLRIDCNIVGNLYLLWKSSCLQCQTFEPVKWSTENESISQFLTKHALCLRQPQFHQRFSCTFFVRMSFRQHFFTYIRTFICKKKLQKWHLYEKSTRKMLMKLTPCQIIQQYYQQKCPCNPSKIQPNHLTKALLSPN